MVVCIPEAIALEAPRTCRSFAGGAIMEGHTVICVIGQYGAEAKAVLGRYVEYETHDSPVLEGAIWLDRRDVASG